MSAQARKNIKLCFPELSKSQQKKLVNESLHHTSCAFFELAYLWYRPVQQVVEKIKTGTVDESFNQPNRAKIIIAPHHGSWESLNFWLAEQGPFFALYKPSKSGGLDQLIIDSRGQSGAQLVPINTAGLRSLLKALKNNATCVILPDQRPGKNTAQIDAPFFGHQAPTSLLIKKLATKVDCDIFIGAITRRLQTADYAATVKLLDREPLIGDDLTSASYLNHSIEQFIKDDLSQYQWPYRRFHKEQYR
jgi:KDO2-lipid IV(A) lauroyltransferase